MDETILADLKRRLVGWTARLQSDGKYLDAEHLGLTLTAIEELEGERSGLRKAVERNYSIKDAEITRLRKALEKIADGSAVDVKDGWMVAKARAALKASPPYTGAAVRLKGGDNTETDISFSSNREVIQGEVGIEFPNCETPSRQPLEECICPVKDSDFFQSPDCPIHGFVGRDDTSAEMSAGKEGAMPTPSNARTLAPPEAHAEITRLRGVLESIGRICDQGVGEIARAALEASPVPVVPPKDEWRMKYGKVLWHGDEDELCEERGGNMLGLKRQPRNVPIGDTFDGEGQPRAPGVEDRYLDLETECNVPGCQLNPDKSMRDEKAWDAAMRVNRARTVAWNFAIEEAARVAENNDDDCSYTSLVCTERRRIAAAIRALKDNRDADETDRSMEETPLLAEVERVSALVQRLRAIPQDHDNGPYWDDMQAAADALEQMHERAERAEAEVANYDRIYSSNRLRGERADDHNG